MPLHRSALFDTIAVLGVGLLVGLGYWLAPLTPTRTGSTARPEAGCDLHVRPCTATLPHGGHLALSIQPRPIPLSKPLAVEVRLRGIDATRVELDLVGADMTMAPNRSQLAHAEDGVFRGQATVPVCAKGKMRWHANVTVESSTGRITIPFGFDSMPY